MTLKVCDICGETIDVAACNQIYSVTTKVVDSDQNGTKKKRKYHCGLCTLKIEDYIRTKLKHPWLGKRLEAEGIVTLSTLVDEDNLTGKMNSEFMGHGQD